MQPWVDSTGCRCTVAGDHGDTGKTMPWQGSAGVPLIVVGPNVVQGVVRTTPVSIMDLAATFLDYGGGALAPGMTSRSMRALFEGTNDTVRDFVHSGLQSGNFGTDEVVPDNEGAMGCGCCAGVGRCGGDARLVDRVDGMSRARCPVLDC